MNQLEILNKYSKKAEDFIFAQRESDVPEKKIAVASLCHAFFAEEIAEKIQKELTLDYFKDFEILKKHKNDIDIAFGGSIFPVFEMLLYSQITIKRNNNSTSERKYQDYIISNFYLIDAFKNYKFIESEKKLIDGDRIDILAEEKETKRSVIIELKIGNKSGRKQLRSYSTHFNKPILINISEEEVITKTDDIIYLTYNGLNISLDSSKSGGE